MQINNLTLIPNWCFGDAEGRRLHVSLLPLLDAIERCKKLTRAAQECDLSYRHAWNILQEAEMFFGAPVTLKQRGRGASLTKLGQVLLQANQRLDARLHTQMESLAMELNAQVQKVLSDHAKVLNIYASHGYAVALIPKHLKGFQTSLHYHGSSDALKALHAGSCKIAGFTLPLHHRIASQRRRYDSLVDRSDTHILGFIKRQVGFMVSPDAERGISGVDDIVEQNLRFINRQPRSGTRELFDQFCSEASIDMNEIKGYDQYEYTHSAVAAQVATGMADVGFGIETAAARFKLKFVPATEDVYLWAYKESDESAPEIESFKSMLKETMFQEEVNKLPGYECERCGDDLAYVDLLS